MEQIVPLKVISDVVRQSRKFKKILTSIQDVGVIEPPVVSRDRDLKNRLILLDGHLRLEALKVLKAEHVVCLISTGDEAFTYNRHISRISAIQEHRMIAKAVERGVSEEKIANLLTNAKVLRYLAQNHAEILSQFQKTAEKTSLASKVAST